MEDYEEYGLTEKDFENLKFLKTVSDEQLIEYVKNLVKYAYHNGVAKRFTTELNETLNDKSR